MCGSIFLDGNLCIAVLLSYMRYHVITRLHNDVLKEDRYLYPDRCCIRFYVILKSLYKEVLVYKPSCLCC